VKRAVDPKRNTAAASSSNAAGKPASHPFLPKSIPV
jgi:flagellar transcriptional activator FlhC